MNSIFRKSNLKYLILFIFLIALGVLAAVEFNTFTLEAHCLARFAHNLTYSLQPGPNPSFRIPDQGPYDERLGYTRLPDFLKSLGSRGYRIESQARLSTGLQKILDWGLYPTFQEKSQAGLSILADDGRVLFNAQFPERVYNNFESIPPLIVETLLFIENRELLDPRHPFRNPAVEWDRLAKAVIDKGINFFNPAHRFAGGSTLATQLEKFRHSPDGRTTDGGEKLRQMASASLRAYRNGKDTTQVRRRIVLDYLNSVPLAGLPGYGEVNGIGDGLWAVFGRDFNSANTMLAPGNRPDDDKEKAETYKQVLSLFIAQRRPSFYLVTNRGALEAITNNYLRQLGTAGVISPTLCNNALKTAILFRNSPPALPQVSFVGRKGVNAIRKQLSTILKVPRLYDLDRLDLSVKSTINAETQNQISRLLLDLREQKNVAAAGLQGPRLLDRGNPGDVIYSFTLYERVGNANVLRIQTDNFNQPFDINEGVKIELGSTAKLRTLVTYLEIIASLHEHYSDMPSEKLREVTIDQGDRLTQWALDYLSTTRDHSLKSMLEAAMERRYSASPGEAFFTGGGRHVFHNFNKADNAKNCSLREGLQNSVNLVFIRLMRDIVRYYMYHVPGSTAKILADVENPARQVYLARFADQEGRIFLRRFHAKYRSKKPEEQRELLFQSLRPAPHRLAAAFRYVNPNADLGAFTLFLQSRLPHVALPAQKIERLFEEYGPEKWDLQDRGYITRIHPLELWLVAYLQSHPGANLPEIIQAGREERQEVYRWLFKTGRKNAQDIRIRSLLEVEAFLEIHQVWKRLGYPFDSLVPSYATAIGSSADRPASLAELVGIIVNDGVQYPVIRIGEMRFASGTPYETLLMRREATGLRVLAPEIAAVLRSALIDVVEKGSAQRMRGAFRKEDGTVIPVGGKTGTGDNRYETFGRRGQVIESRAVNRAAVFVFFIGDRFFGTITAYVPGAEAANYDFTSSLPVHILKLMAPALAPLINKPEISRESSPGIMTATPARDKLNLNPVPFRNRKSQTKAELPFT